MEANGWFFCKLHCSDTCHNEHLQKINERECQEDGCTSRIRPEIYLNRMSDYVLKSEHFYCPRHTRDLSKLTKPRRKCMMKCEIL